MDVRIKKAVKSLAGKSQIDNALDITEKNGGNISTFHLNTFTGKSHFENNEIQNYLAFQSAFKYFKMPSTKSSQIIAWKSNGLSEESIKPSTTLNKNLNPETILFLMVPKLK